MKKFRNPQQRPKKSQLLIGKEAVLKALQEGAQLERIYMQNTLHGAEVEEIKKHAEIQLVPINKVPVASYKNAVIFVLKKPVSIFW